MGCSRLLWLTGLLLAAGCGSQEGRCGSGSWRPGALELHHFAIGQADATLVVGPQGHTLLVDLGEAAPDSAAGAERVGAAIEGILGCRRLDQVAITHFHLDHVGAAGQGGLWHLIERQGFRVGRVLHRDFRGYLGEDGPTGRGWREYLAGAAGRGLRIETAAEGTWLDLGPEVQARVVAVDGGGALAAGDFSRAEAPPSENDYSVALWLRRGRFDYFLGGDLSGEHLINRGGWSYHDVETAVAARLGDVDVYRVNHHGSAHASNATLLGQLDPEVAVVSAGRGNPHGHPHPQTLERLLATSAVYLTEAGATGPLGAAKVVGDVVVRTWDGLAYTVAGQGFAALDPPRLDADGDGYFREVDPDDDDRAVIPLPFGGCDPLFQSCP